MGILWIPRREGQSVDMVHLKGEGSLGGPA